MDGTATFNNVIGGSIQIIAYPVGIENCYEACNLQIQEPANIHIKLEKYVLLGPLLIEVSHLTTLILILLTVILFFSVEVYRKKNEHSVAS